MASRSAPKCFQPFSAAELSQLTEISSWTEDCADVVFADVTRGDVAAGLVLGESQELTISNALARLMLQRLAEAQLELGSVAFVSHEFEDCIAEGQGGKEREELVDLMRSYSLGASLEEANTFVFLRCCETGVALSDAQAWQFATFDREKRVARIYDPRNGGSAAALQFGGTSWLVRAVLVLRCHTLFLTPHCRRSF